MNSAIRELLAPIARRVRSLVARGVVELVNDAAKMQALQLSIRDGEVVDDAERFQSYGFTTHPRPGAEAIVLSVGGLADHPVVIAVDDRRYRLAALAEGEVAVFDDLGQKIHLKRDRIEVTSPRVVVLSSNVELGAANLVSLTDGVVVAQGIDSFTGATYGVLGNASAKIKAAK